MTIRLPAVALWGGLAALLAAPTARLSGQTTAAPSAPQSPPVFRASTNLVEVDFVVHDDRNHFVLGLTADDLDLFEDGKPQRIQQCYLVRTDETTGVSSAEDGAPDMADLRSHRVFVLLFDEGDLDTGALLRIKSGAEAFIAQQFTEGDVGAVVVNGRFYQGKLTTSRATLLAGVRAVKPAFDSRESRLRSFREFPRIPGEAEAVRIDGGDRFLIQQLGEEACRDDPATCNQEGGLQQVENKLQQKARNYIGQARDATRYTLEAVQMVASALSALPGRKTVVFFSDGFFIEESRGVLRQMAGIAARARATIYAIDGRGQAGSKPPGPDVLIRDRPLSGTLDTGDDGPALLADATGGFVVRNMDDVAKALGTIAHDTSTYYVLGYQPANSVMDGKFRTIVVKAKNPSLNIRARKGYVAAPLPHF
jgi:VWFA-related protein